MANVAQLPLNTDLFHPPKDKLNSYLPSLSRRQKQTDFVLNCDSTEWKLPEYNSLNDNHLKYFFANPRVRSVLVKTGMIDATGNINKDRSKTSNFPCSTQMKQKLKLDPLPENTNMAIQRIVLPYRARKPKNKPLSIQQNPSAPVRRALTMGNNVSKPKTIQSMISKGRSLASMRNVQPMSKDQLAEVFAKYQMKSEKPRQASGTDESTVAEEGGASPNDRKSDFSIAKSKQLQTSEVEERKITISSIDILNSDKKEETLSEHEEKVAILGPGEVNWEKVNKCLDKEGDFELVENVKVEADEQGLAKSQKSEYSFEEDNQEDV